MPLLGFLHGILLFLFFLLVILIELVIHFEFLFVLLGEFFDLVIVELVVLIVIFSLKVASRLAHGGAIVCCEGMWSLTM